MNPQSLEIVERYLAGEVDLESAAQAMHMDGEFGLHFSPDNTTPADQERIEALFGRVIWLSFRESSPDSVPDQPFGAAEFRAIADAFLDHAGDETPDQLNDTDPSGAA